MRPWFKKKRFILPLALLALVLLGRLSGGNDEAPIAAVPAEPTQSVKTNKSAEPTKTADPTRAAPSKAIEEKSDPEPPTEPDKPKIGDAVVAGDWRFKVTKFRCGETSVGSRYLDKKAQGQFCLLNINATNNGNDEGTLDSNGQKLLDTNGKEYSSDYEASVYEDSDSALFLEGVNPGNTAKGLVVFDVPKKVRPTQVSLRGGFFGESVLVDLQ